MEGFRLARTGGFFTDDVRRWLAAAAIRSNASSSSELLSSDEDDEEGALSSSWSSLNRDIDRVLDDDAASCSPDNRGVLCTRPC